MTTFAELRRRIAQDLDRHLERLHGDEIGRAVKDAIKFYAHEHLAFNELEETSVDTVAGTASYARPSNVVETDLITITANGTTYPLLRQSWDWYKERAYQPSAIQGLPTDWTFYNDKYWFYPTPDAVYDVTIWGTDEFDELADDTDANSWTRATASELIRARAKADLYLNRLEMPELAMAQQVVADQQLRRLRESATTRLATGRIRPTCF